MRKLISLLALVGVMGGLGPFATLAFATEHASANDSVSASPSCLTLPELSRVRQAIAQRALETDNPVETYRITVHRVQRTKTAVALAAQSDDCVAGLRTALLTDVRGRTLIRLADCCDTTADIVDLGFIDPRDFSTNPNPGPGTTIQFDIGPGTVTSTLTGGLIAALSPFGSNKVTQALIAAAGTAAAVTPTTTMHVTVTIGADGHVSVEVGKGGASSDGVREGPQGGGGGG